MKNLNQVDDHELLRLMLSGNDEAFTTLYRRRSSVVFRFAHRMCGGMSTIAEDVTQDVFLILMRDGARFDHTRGSLTTYLLGIARNQVLRRLSSYRPLVAIPEGEESGPSSDSLKTEPAVDPLGQLTRAETIENVRQAVLALPTHYREVVVLCDLEEMSYAEASEILDCAVGTVRSRLHRARNQLVVRLSSLKTGARTEMEQKPMRSLL